MVPICLSKGGAAKNNAQCCFTQLWSTPLDPKQVATFVRENPHLDKKQIGEYVSNRKNLEILEAFVLSFDFGGLRLDEALR